jgi:hypothetical protein
LGDFVKSEILDDKELSFASEKIKFYEIGVMLPVRSRFSSLSFNPSFLLKPVQEPSALS